MIIPLTTFLIILEYFKMPDGRPDVTGIIKRACISIILLVSFEEILHIISFVGDGIVEYIGGMHDIKEVLAQVSKTLDNVKTGWFKFKEAIIFIFTLISYIAAYLGVFIADALINFCWGILYIVSPMMILMYISPATSPVTKNLYKGLLTVMSWKILWTILGALLLKFSTAVPTDGDNYNFVLLVVMNFFIGASMLFIPIATKSLIADGFSGFATGLGSMPALAAKNTFFSGARGIGRGAVARTGKTTGSISRFAGRKGLDGFSKVRSLYAKSRATSKGVNSEYGSERLNSWDKEKR